MNPFLDDLKTKQNRYIAGLYLKYKQLETALSTAYLRCFSTMEILENKTLFVTQQGLMPLKQKGIIQSFESFFMNEAKGFSNPFQTLINYQIPFILLLVESEAKLEFLKRLKKIHPHPIRMQTYHSISYIIPYEEKIRMACEALTYEKWGRVGLAVYPFDGHLWMDLMNKAIEQLLASPYTDSEETNLQQTIQSLIKNHDFTLHYQPIYDLKEKVVSGYEALFRANSSYNNEQIFRRALKTNLINALDQCIIERAVSEIETVVSQLPNNLHFTLNISPKTFLTMNVYAFFKRLLETYHVSGSQIGIELTEQFYIGDEERINHQLSLLKSLGISIYLDDFGMGYSSLRDLAFLQFDHIKLDKRITESIQNGNRVERLVQTLLDYAFQTNCDIIFEGVETLQQYHAIESIGGRFIQGYFISKPLVLNQAIHLLKKGG